MRSPMCEKITPPSGRTRKARAKVASANIWLTSALSLGKNCLAKIMDDMVPYRK
ncbi:hypothetical protein D3C78_1738110 [compost metagenome]